MAEKSSFFNAVINGGIPDRSYKAEEFARFFSSFISNGVFPNPSTNLQVLSLDNNMTVNVKQGLAWINGYFYENTDNLSLNIDNADGVLNRIDLVVVRLDFINREINCKIKKGTFASNPIVPSLTRTQDRYELCIATIRVNAGATAITQNMVTDTRLDSNACGIVTQTVKEIDTTTLFAKLEAYIDERGQDVEGWIGEATSKWERDFITWFDTIKDVLDGDVAGALANRILALEDMIGSGLTADNILMNDGSSVEASIALIKQEIDGQRVKAIGLYNRLDKVF